jgi:CheY-like chemotaxis protein
MPHALIIDRDPLMQRMFGELVAECGFQATCVADWHDGLRWMQATVEPALVLHDSLRSHLPLAEMRAVLHTAAPALRRHRSILLIAAEPPLPPDITAALHQLNITVLPHPVDFLQLLQAIQEAATQLSQPPYSDES